MARSRRVFFVAAVLALSIVRTVPAWSSIDCPGCTANVEEGDNRATTSQNGASTSGDAVGGQVGGFVSSGRLSADARNVSRNSDVTSGDASASNSAAAVTGQVDSHASTESILSDISNVPHTAANVQEGNNTLNLVQSTAASTGDAVGGQVLGAVVAAGGSASIVADNASDDVFVQTGDASTSNRFAAHVGLAEQTGSGLKLVISDITNSFAWNVQEGSNRLRADQSATASSGDGVAGQVIGVVSAGSTSVDATNRSTSVDVTSGDADAANHVAAFVGLANPTGGSGSITADITNAGPENVQEGNNRGSLSQTARAATGDGVGGEVVGVVTSAGGSASVVASNATSNSDVTTGDADSANHNAAFVGLDFTSNFSMTADISSVHAMNVQEGSNSLVASQTASSGTGDGIAGQVIGVVSAGAASVDARNRSDNVSARTGDASADNHEVAFVGLLDAGGSAAFTADITNSTANNLQEGSNRAVRTQTADASSGDTVLGQVSGVVTSAGGSASVVVDNVSANMEGQTGEGSFSNGEVTFVGQSLTGGPLTLG